MLKYLLGLLLLTLQVELIGQKKRNQNDSSQYLIQPNRIEFDFNETNISYELINCEEEGLLVLKETNRMENGAYGWVIYKLDTSLQIVWEQNIFIPSASILKGWSYSAGYVYLLFNAEQYKQTDLRILRISLATGSYEVKEFTTVFPLDLHYFESIGSTLLLGGTTNFRPVVLTYDYKEMVPRVIPGLYQENISIVDISIDQANELFTVVSLELLANKQFTVSTRTYTHDNLQLTQQIINPGERKNLIDGATTYFNNGSQYISGTYSKKSLQYSRGLYLSRFSNGRQQFMKYYEYSQLTNFFGYLRSSRQNKIKEKIDRKSLKGKQKRFSYRLLVHEIVEQKDGQYVLIGEAYFPRYSNYNVTDTYGFGSNFPGNSVYTNIIGYRYTHAIIVGFDRNGNILWDHSFSLDNVFNTQLENVVTVHVEREYIELLFLEKNTIKSKIVRNNEIIEGKTYNPVRLSNPDDEIRIKDPKYEKIEKWYKGAFIAYGEQNLEKKSSSTFRLGRDVFYINKVTYDVQSFSN